MGEGTSEDPVARAMAALREDDPVAAETALRTALKDDPAHPLLRNNLAALIARHGDAAEALRLLE